LPKNFTAKGSGKSKQLAEKMAAKQLVRKNRYS